MDKTKHRKAFFALGGLFVVLVLIFSLVQCTQSYSVTFDTDGGNEIPAVSVNKDDTVSRPQNPTKNGFTFAYWELDGEEFDFSQPITADIKLKAIWEQVDDDETDPDDDSEPVITTQTERRTAVINFKTIEENDSTLDAGKTSIKQTGVNGQQIITYTVTYTDGRETSRVEVSRTTTRQPVNRIVLVGTKEKESVYTFGTHRPANFLGSPQVVVTVYKDGTAVSANTVYDNTTVLGDKNNDQGLLLIDESLINFVNRAQLANGTFVNVSKGGQ